MTSYDHQQIKGLFREFETNPKFCLFEERDDQAFIKNTIAEERLDFQEEEIYQSKVELLKYLNAERILGSYIYIGILIGLISAGVTLYFLSLAIPIAALIGVGIGIILVCTLLGFVLKKRVRKFEVKIFEKRIIRSFFRWSFKRMGYYVDDLNKRRILIENTLSRFRYIETLHPKMQGYLERYFIHKFNELYKQQKVALYLSLRIVSFLSNKLTDGFGTFFQTYLDNVLYPLMKIARRKDSRFDPEFEDFLIKAETLLGKLECPNPFKPREGKANAAPGEIIVVTKTFFISKQQDQFFDLIQIWNLPNIDFNASMVEFKTVLRTQNELENNNKINEIALSMILDDSAIEIRRTNVPNTDVKDRILDINQFDTNNVLEQSQQMSQVQVLKDLNTSITKSVRSSRKNLTCEPSLAPPEDPQIDYLIKIISEDTSNFTKVFSNEKLTVLKKVPEDSPAVIVKTTVELDCPPEYIFELIYDLNWRFKWDNVLSRLKIVDTVSPNTDIMYSFFKSPMGVANRDFLQKRTFIHNVKGARTIIVFSNAKHPKCPPVADAIRAFTIISGYFIKEITPQKTHLTVVSQSDIKGHVPKWIVNYAASKAPMSWLKRLEYGISLIKASNQ
jgi:hypothetical protein